MTSYLYRDVITYTVILLIFRHFQLNFRILIFNLFMIRGDVKLSLKDISHLPTLVKRLSNPILSVPMIQHNSVYQHSI
jgi:hypothetical protein